MSIDIEKLAETLEGTCLSLCSACEHCGFSDEDLSHANRTELDEKVFECACCGWWGAASDANECRGDLICSDCSEEENVS